MARGDGRGVTFVRTSRAFARRSSSRDKAPTAWSASSTRVEFQGRGLIDFDRLGAARDRAQGPPPEPLAPGPETSDGETARTATEDPGPQEQEAEKAGPATLGEP